MRSWKNRPVGIRISWKLRRSTSTYRAREKKLLITGIIYDILCGALQFYVSISSYTAGSVCSQSGLGVDVVTFGNTCSFMDQEFTD